MVDFSSIVCLLLMYISSTIATTMTTTRATKRTAAITAGAITRPSLEEEESERNEDDKWRTKTMQQIEF